MQEPFVGKEALRGYFDKVSKIIPPDLKFNLDEVTSGDPHFVGVKWWESLQPELHSIQMDAVVAGPTLPLQLLLPQCGCTSAHEHSSSHITPYATS